MRELFQARLLREKSQDAGHAMTHPLIGRLLWLGDDDPELFPISRFTDDLGGGLMLAARLDPRTGELLAASHVVSLQPHCVEAEIFADWKSLMRAVDCPEDGKRVVQLGPELVKPYRLP